MTDLKIRYAIIGCGEHALQSHALPGLQVPELELVAVCDPDIDRLADFMGALDVPVQPMTEEEILADPSIDAVLIASPDRFHSGSLARAIEAGKHVLCEKPLATTRKEVAQLVRMLLLANQNDLIITSCHPRRTDPSYMWIKETLPDLVDRYGRVLSLHLDFSCHAPSKEGLHKGLLIDHINHELDTANFLLGHSHTTMRRIFDSQTHYQAAGYRTDGVMLVFEGTRMLRQRVYPEYVRIRFERADVSFDCRRGVMLVNDHELGRAFGFDMPRIDYEARFVAVTQNFANTILGRAENYLTPTDLIENTTIGVELTEAQTWDSAR